MAKDYLVGITKLNNEKLTVSLIHNGKILDEIVLTGEIEDDYFSVKRKYFLIPIPALLIHKETKNLLCNSPNGALVIMHGYKSGGWILFMAANGGGISNHQFKKMKF